MTQNADLQSHVQRKDRELAQKVVAAQYITFTMLAIAITWGHFLL